MKTLFTFQFWACLRLLPINVCASGELLWSDDYLMGFPNSLLCVPCSHRCFSLFGKLSSCLWHPDRLGFPKEWTLLLDWLLCFPGSFSVRRRKHWSTVPVVDKCGFCWMLFNGGQLPCRTCYSFSWLTKVDEIQLGIFWKCWTWILRKQLAIYSIKHTYQVD